MPTLAGKQAKEDDSDGSNTVSHSFTMTDMSKLLAKDRLSLAATSLQMLTDARRYFQLSNTPFTP